MKNKLSIILNLAIGVIGAIGEAVLLRQDLVNRYPYKVMGPLSAVYAGIGEWGLLISPLVALVVALIFLRANQDYLAVLPVVVCPFVFWLLFEWFFWQSGFSAAMMKHPQFDQYTGNSVRQVFIQTVLMLASIGLVVGWSLARLVRWGTHRFNQQRSLVGSY